MKYLKSFNENKIFSNIKIENDKIYFYVDNNQIGYVEYHYDGSSISEHIPSNAKEFYLSMIEVYKEYEGNNLSKYILDYIKKYAKQLGATIITLRVDYGLGYTERNTNSYLDKIYIKNGFNYYFTDKECELDDTKGLGTMYFIV